MTIDYFQEISSQDESEQLPFFVYGTLRPPDFNYQAHLAGRTTLERGGFYLPQAELYSLGRFPGVTETPTKPSQVWGDLIYVSPTIYPAIRAELDQLEWYEPGKPNNRYWRVIRTVHSNEGEAVRAWVYVAEWMWIESFGADTRLIESGDWLAWLQTTKKPGQE